jgi:SAM-dependent methyltransferase
MTATVDYEGRDLEVLADMPNYYSWIMETFAPHVRGDVVEFGAGSGTVSARLAPLAKTLTLVEPSDSLIGHLRARFKDAPGVTVVGEMLETYSEKMGKESVDTIVMVNVLEHIEDDRKALAKLIASVRPGGRLLIFVPALQFLMSKLDLVHGHFRRYHKPDLVTKVTAAGGNVLSCRYFDLVGVAPWFLLNKLMGSTTFNPTLVRINDNVAVPITRRIESIVPAPFGKNLILVAAKP